MERVFNVLDDTINKSTINNFRNFTNKFHNVTKWFMCSDYCVDDKGKPNDVMTFVVYPYILDFHEWADVIQALQKTDLKNCRKISREFCDFSHKGYFFSFNFLIEKNSFIRKWKNPDILGQIIDFYIDMINEKWKVNTPHQGNYYNELEAKLNNLKNTMVSKNFNYKLLSRTLFTVFLASYIKYLLLQEIDKVEAFAWFSDRDKITSCYDTIYEVLYAIVSHCMCYNHLPEEKYIHIKECLPGNIETNIFYDEILRTADFICGGIADFDLQTGHVHKQKHCTLIEDVIADNPYISILIFHANGIARCSHKKHQPT